MDQPILRDNERFGEKNIIQYFSINPAGKTSNYFILRNRQGKILYGLDTNGSIIRIDANRHVAVAPPSYSVNGAIIIENNACTEVALENSGAITFNLTQKSTVFHIALLCVKLFPTEQNQQDELTTALQLSKRKTFKDILSQNERGNQLLIKKSGFFGASYSVNTGIHSLTYAQVTKITRIIDGIISGVEL